MSFVFHFFTYLKIKYYMYLFDINSYKINSDFSVDVFGNVYIDNLNLKKIPVQFNQIFGNFDCSYNNLLSLKGIPIKTEGTFYCDNNDVCHSSEHLLSDNVCSKYISKDLNVHCRQKIFLLNNIL